MNKLNLKNIAIGVLLFVIIGFSIFSCNSCTTTRKLKAQIAELSEQNDEFRKNNRELNIQIYELNKTNDELKEENAKFSANNLVLEDKINSLNKDIIYLNNLNKQLKLTIEGLDKKFIELLDRLEEQVKRLEDMYYEEW